MFHSFVAKLRPVANDFSMSAGSRMTSAPSPRPAISVQRNASAPKSETTSSGSMPLPSDFDMRRCWVSRAVPCRYTVWYGARPTNS